VRSRSLVHNHFVLFALSRAGDASYVGAFGTWLQLPSAAALSAFVGSVDAPALLAVMNAAVFACWLLLPAPFVHRHFSCDSLRCAARRPWTLATASFSEPNLLALIANVYSLLSVAPILQGRVGDLRLAQLYLAGGAAASLGGAALRALLGRRPRGGTASAAAAVYALVAAVAVLSPRTRFGWYGVEISGWQLLAANLATHLAMGSGADMPSHVCGAALGAAAALAWRRRVPRWLRPLSRWWAS
jgi:membrane associated rhomboid family serine protease